MRAPWCLSGKVQREVSKKRNFFFVWNRKDNLSQKHSQTLHISKGMSLGESVSSAFFPRNQSEEEHLQP